MPIKSDKVFIEPIAGYHGLLEYVEANKKEFGFGKEEFDETCRENIFTESTLSSRYDQKWCQEVIDKVGSAANSYWDRTRPYYPAILAFMKDYSLETVRFNHDL
jgi:hypothetical protein